jgi:hypothetical protein
VNTDSGRIYDLSELYPDEKQRSAQMEADARLMAMKLASLPTPEVEWSDPAIKLSIAEQRRELAAANAIGKAVPVSGEVAQTMKLGQRELSRRSRRRKAAKQARKNNR